MAKGPNGSDPHYENLHSTDGPHAPQRDKSPEHNYPAIERETGVNRKDPGGSKASVNIKVKGGEDPTPQDDRATGMGSRDAPSLSKE